MAQRVWLGTSIVSLTGILVGIASIWTKLGWGWSLLITVVCISGLWLSYPRSRRRPDAGEGSVRPRAFLVGENISGLEVAENESAAEIFADIDGGRDVQFRGNKQL